MIVYTRHARAQMYERGILEPEIVETINSGELVEIAKGRRIHRRVFTAGYEREGKKFPHKEITVVYVEEGDDTIVITAIARYGRWEMVS